MKCSSPITLKNVSEAKYPNGLEIGCGKCTACRINKREEWSMRCLHELDDHQHSIFVTLTYDEYNIPSGYTLKKKHLQDFIKRLRYYLEPRKIKYFACGEYGEKSYRPHYHAILFNVGFDDIEYIKNAWSFCDWSTQTHAFGEANIKSIRYCSKYIDKSYSGKIKKQFYDDHNLEIPFKLQSKALGKNYALKIKDRINKLFEITVQGKSMPIPRYYRHICETNNIEFQKKIIDQQKKKYFELLKKDDITQINMRSKLEPGEYIELLKKQYDSLVQQERNLKKQIKLQEKNNAI